MDRLDIKLWNLASKGQIVPDRSLLKTPEQIAEIRKSADLKTAVLDHGAIPAPLNFEGFPKSVCTSINNVICHGIPSEDEILQDGDIINVDVSTILNGYYSDASRMFAIGILTNAVRRLCVSQKNA